MSQDHAREGTASPAAASSGTALPSTSSGTQLGSALRGLDFAEQSQVLRPNDAAAPVERPSGSAPTVAREAAVQRRAIHRSAVQRVPGERSGADSGGGDAELGAALDELDRALASRPDPGRYEAITASTGTEGAYVGDVTRQAPHRWQHQRLDYGAVAREQADADTTTTSEAHDGADLLSAPEGPANPTRSASLPGAPSRRVGLFVTCADYVGTVGDIPDFAAVAAANRSGAEAGSGGLDEAEALDNPTAAEFLARLDAAIAGVAGQLGAGQTGELTVGIAAHGGAGEVIFADTARVSYAALQARARAARARGVRLVFVIDACLSGEMAQRANEDATVDLAMSAAGNGRGQREARALLDVVRRVNPALHDANTQGGQVRLRGRDYSRTGSESAYAALIRALRGLTLALDDVGGVLRAATLPPDQRARLPAALEAIAEANLVSLRALSADQAGVRQTVRMAGAAIDAVNAIVAGLLERAASLTASAAP